MKEHISTFISGIDKDSSKVSIENTKATHIENMRILTDTGGTTKALINIKGNESFLDFPDTSSVYKITTCDKSTFGDGNSTFNVNISGTIFSFISVEDFNDIAIQLNNYITNSILSLLNIVCVADNSNTSIVVYSTSGIDFTITITASDSCITTTKILDAILGINLNPIGFTTIRDNIFIITTPETTNTDILPIPNGGGAAQIWKITYNLETLIPTLTLLYNNLLNITTYHPIPPTAFTGRYETADIQRIYFTDNFNSLRNFNTVDPKGFATNPILLDREPPITSNVPILQTIDNNGNSSLVVGMYEATYRLKNGNTTSVFGPTSNLVQIVPADEATFIGGGNFITYIGANSGTITNKKITWKISNLDTDYERIEIVILQKTSLTGSPVITITHDEPVPENGEFIFSYTGKELISELTLNEFLNTNFSFTQCKTIATKDNRLVVANTRLTKTDFDFDSRAYRFKSNGGSYNDFTIKDSQGNNYTYIANFSSNFNNIPKTHDTINPDNSTLNLAGINDPKNIHILGSQYLGGTGTNISYEFGTEFVKGDSTTQLVAGQSVPFRHANPNFAVSNFSDGAGNIYPINSTNDGLKGAYRASIFKGYQRNEVYRFAIQFIDKQGKFLFAKWIGDIKMPDYNDTCDPANRGTIDNSDTGKIPTDFRLSFMTDNGLGSNDECWLSILYIKFNVNVPQDILQFISGFQIVRVERTLSDKSILGTGLLFPTFNDGSHLALPGSLAFSYMNINGSTNQLPFAHTIQCPEFLHGGYPGYTSNDKVVIRQKLDLNNSVNSLTIGGGSDPYNIYKNYNSILLSGIHPQKILPLQEAADLGVAGDYSFTGSASPFSFGNYRDAGGGDSDSLGSHTLVIGTSQTLVYNIDLDITEGNGQKAYIQYYRTNSSQYGGNTFSQRSRNIYIQCGDFQSIPLDTTSSISYTHKVFGGDIFMVIYDNQKAIKNWGASQGTTRGVATPSYSTTFFFPCECTHNTELRSGTTVNKDLKTDDGIGASAFETYNYNTVYSSENNIVTAISKPIDFKSVEEYDSRIWIAEEKINGESKDSWAVFKTNNWRDAQSDYGPINALITFKNQILYYQDKGFGLVPINQRSLLNDTSATDIIPTQIGTGLLIDIPRYISTKVGCKHQWGIINSDEAVAWFDGNSRVMNRYRGGDKEEAISDIKGLQAFFPTTLIGRIQTIDNPIHKNISFNNNRCGISCVYDYRFNEFIFTFIDSQNINNTYQEINNTIAFNSQTDNFTSFYTFYPGLYISDTKNFFTSDPANPYKIYLHNTGDYCKFYNQTPNESRISFVVNSDPKNTKVFENIEYLTEILDTQGVNNINITDKTWDKMRFYTDSQNSDYITPNVGTTIRRRERKWQLPVSRNIIKQTGGDNLNIFDSNNFDNTRLFKDKMRDLYLTIDFRYLNTDNYKIVCPYIKTLYQVSPR